MIVTEKTWCFTAGGRTEGNETATVTGNRKDGRKKCNKGGGVNRRLKKHAPSGKRVEGNWVRGNPDDLPIPPLPGHESSERGKMFQRQWMDGSF